MAARAGVGRGRAGVGRGGVGVGGGGGAPVSRFHECRMQGGKMKALEMEGAVTECECA